MKYLIDSGQYDTIYKLLRHGLIDYDYFITEHQTLLQYSIENNHIELSTYLSAYLYIICCNYDSEETYLEDIFLHHDFFAIHFIQVSDLEHILSNHDFSGLNDLIVNDFIGIGYFKNQMHEHDTEQDDFFQSSLHYSVENNCIKMTSFLLKAGADARISEEGWGGPLKIARRENYIEIVDMLLNWIYDNDINYYSDILSKVIADKDNILLSTELKKRNASYFDTFLYKDLTLIEEALYWENFDAIRILIENGVLEHDMKMISGLLEYMIVYKFGDKKRLNLIHILNEYHILSDHQIDAIIKLFEEEDEADDPDVIEVIKLLSKDNN